MLLNNLQANQLSLLVGLVGGAAAFLLQGLAFLIRRWWTGESTHERVAHLSTLADLRAKMQAGGMTLEDVRLFEASLSKGDLATVVQAGAEGTIEGEDGKLPPRYWTTYAMRMRAGARLGSLDAELFELLTDLGTMIDEKEEAELFKVQRAWLAYRQREMRYAASRYDGGTMAPLVAVSHGIRLAEERIEQVRTEVRERKTNPI